VRVNSPHSMGTMLPIMLLNGRLSSQDPFKSVFSGTVFPWLTSNSICRSFPTVCSGVNVFFGIFRPLSCTLSLNPTGTKKPVQVSRVNALVAGRQVTASAGTRPTMTQLGRYEYSGFEPALLLAIKMKAASRWQSALLWLVLVGLLCGGGFWLRGLTIGNTKPGVGLWKSWTKSTVVTLYFADGPLLFPVSRQMPVSENLPQLTLQSLLNGPGSASGLTNPVPGGVKIRSMTVVNGVAKIDLSAEFLEAPAETDLAASAVAETLTALPEVHAVELSVTGKPFGSARQRTPLLYYASANGLVAVPSPATNPRDAIARFLEGPPAGGATVHWMTGLPSDVRLLNYNYDPSERAASLNFSYTQSLHTFALEAPERMRLVLLGLIASLTEFREVESVQLDFDGHTRLGVGQCSDLLRTRQPRPELLNDERLLRR
jgi:spore germination protein GerM